MSTDSALADHVRNIFVEEATDLLGRAERAVSEMSSASPEAYGELLLELRRTLHTLKGAAAAVGQEQLKIDVHELETLVEHLSRDDAAGLDTISQHIERLHQAIASHPRRVAASTPGSTEVFVSVSTDGDRLRIRPERVDLLHTLVGELVIARLQYDALSTRLAELRDREQEAQQMFRQFNAKLLQIRKHLSPTSWDDLQALWENLNTAIKLNVQTSATLSREVPLLQAQSAALSMTLEDGIRELRMMPLQPFFQEYTKVVQELGRESGKLVKLIIRAEGAEIDRAVLLRLRDPLLHLVRNAVVHGIEMPQKRKAAGKAETGSVLLEARCVGTRVIVRVVDDGAGISMKLIENKASEMGLIREGRSLEPFELLDVLSHPGFSTRSSADKMAGRGLGLNVVASVIRELDGKLQLDNVPLSGCIFTLEVPIRAATSTGLVVRTLDHEFGLLLPHVERVLRINVSSIQIVEGQATVMIDKDPVAVVPLAKLLGLPMRPRSAVKRPVVVLRNARQRLGVLVDEIPGDQPLVIKPFGRAFSAAAMFIGGAIQADGSVLPVLQVSALFELAAGLRPNGTADKTGFELDRAKDTVSILVVDDSLTMRTLLRNILQTMRYTVHVAHDGESALAMLETMTNCDLVITDLQMPVMDGIALCRAIRSSSRPNIPIMVVTALGEAEEKRKALDAGADAYIVKSDFEQQHFLDLVVQLTGQMGVDYESIAR